MSYVYINLRADTEEDAKAAAIAAASLPEDQRLVLITPDKDGVMQWRLASENHAFFPNGSRVITPGVYEQDGTEITPPVIDSRFHAILAVRPGMEKYVRQILEAVGLLHVIDMDIDVGFKVMGATE